jgi:hypothetical protein
LGERRREKKREREMYSHRKKRKKKNFFFPLSSQQLNQIKSPSSLSTSASKDVNFFLPISVPAWFNPAAANGSQSSAAPA